MMNRILYYLRIHKKSEIVLYYYQNDEHKIIRKFVETKKIKQNKKPMGDAENIFCLHQYLNTTKIC